MNAIINMNLRMGKMSRGLQRSPYRSGSSFSFFFFLWQMEFHVNASWRHTTTRCSAAASRRSQQMTFIFAPCREISVTLTCRSLPSIDLPTRGRRFAPTHCLIVPTGSLMKDATGTWASRFKNDCNINLTDYLTLQNKGIMAWNIFCWYICGNICCVLKGWRRCWQFFFSFMSCW